jgi:TolB-like protein
MLVQRSPESSRTSGEGTRVAITDFGIARALVEDGAVAANRLTGDAGIVGTPEYMAPEQVTGGDVSQATDVYALGIVLYEMVTGRLPFTADTPLATASRRLNEPPPKPEVTVPGLDPRFSHTILRCLDRDRRRRFQSANDVADSLTSRPSRKWWPVALAAACILVLLLAGVSLLGHRVGLPISATSVGVPVAAQPSIAVLPFLDMSPEHDQEYFSDGVAQEIINALAQVPGLHVAARSSSFSFKGTNEDLRAVAQKLDVATVLEGSVRKSGNHLRVTAQLVSAQDGYQLWSHSFDSELADVFAVQDQIASAVVAALKLKVLPEGGASGSGRKAINPEAYTHYLRGLERQDQGSLPGLREAIEEYEKTVAIAPDYAPAHARIAESAVMYGNGTADAFETREWNLRAIAEADRAVESDPNGIEGLIARGQIRTVVTWDWPGAREDLDRAVALGPGLALAHLRRAQLLEVLGQLPLALDEAKKAVELDPVSSSTLFTLASIYNAAGQYALARTVLKKALENAPQHWLAYRELAFTELLDGRPAAALALFKTHPQQWIRFFGTALAEHSLGNEAASKAAMDALVAFAGGPAMYQIAEAHAWRGEPDAAFEWLEKARVAGDAGTRYVKYDPFLKSLRGDPRYAALLARMKLPPD